MNIENVVTTRKDNAMKKQAYYYRAAEPVIARKVTKTEWALVGFIVAVLVAAILPHVVKL